MVTNTTTCVNFNMAACNDLEKSSMNRTYEIVLDMLGDHCDELVKVRGNL